MPLPSAPPPPPLPASRAAVSRAHPATPPGPLPSFRPSPQSTASSFSSSPPPPPPPNSRPALPGSFGASLPSGQSASAPSHRPQCSGFRLGSFTSSSAPQPRLSPPTSLPPPPAPFPSRPCSSVTHAHPSVCPPPPPSACSSNATAGIASASARPPSLPSAPSPPHPVASPPPPVSPPPPTSSPAPSPSLASASRSSPSFPSGRCSCFAAFPVGQPLHSGAENACAVSADASACAWSHRSPSSVSSSCHAPSCCCISGSMDCSGSATRGALGACETPGTACVSSSCGFQPPSPAACCAHVSSPLPGFSAQRTAAPGCLQCSSCCAASASCSSATSVSPSNNARVCGTTPFPCVTPPPPPPTFAASRGQDGAVRLQGSNESCPVTPPPPPLSSPPASASFLGGNAAEGVMARNGWHPGVHTPGSVAGGDSDGRRASTSFHTVACCRHGGDDAGSAVPGAAVAAPKSEKRSGVPAPPGAPQGCAAVRVPPASLSGSGTQETCFSGGGVPPPPPEEGNGVWTGARASRRGAQKGEGSGDASGQDGFGKKRKKEEEFVCLLCDKAFRTAKKQEQHEEEEHLPCDYPGCTYSGPVHVMVMHKLKHLKNANGESLLDSEAEVAAWLAARKENFPSSRRAAKPKTPASTRPLPRPKSVLERILRETMESAYGRRLIHPAFFSSAFCPELPKMLPHPPLIYSLKREFRYAQLPRSPYTHPSGLCPSSFLVPPGAKGPARDSRAGGPGRSGPEVPLRPPLLYQLLAPEIRMYEDKLIAAIRFIVQSNFFLNEPREEPESEPLIQVIDEQTTTEAGVCPPASSAVFEAEKAEQEEAKNETR
ncbi:nuclear fragile X mental retardation-interacting protein 1 [Toxoplasma gondii VAND]|uniref:Nuclear fragile X mental retardation-interacting protein 1 n=1 Tax=Toxoplasma gondii VAND TaxID=933077 RepID=A0A086QM00_TOXGO|nr:nuclear fragile X mental retardation-interacting protein 1 [Toxoplasma gondii VAND]